MVEPGAGSSGEAAFSWEEAEAVAVVVAGAVDVVVDGGTGTACVFAGGERMGIMVGGFGAPAGFWAQASARR